MIYNWLRRLSGVLGLPGSFWMPQTSHVTLIKSQQEYVPQFFHFTREDSTQSASAETNEKAVGKKKEVTYIQGVLAPGNLVTAFNKG